MEMVDIRKTIQSLFIALKEDIYVLIRIQALVSLVTLLFLVMFFLDYFRCRSRSPLLTTVFKTVDSVSDRIVLYLLGSMQAANFENQMFPVWAVVLVSLRASLGYLSGYGIDDQDRRLSEFGNVIKFMGAGVLNHTRGLEFTKPLWSLWAILLARSIYRFVAHEMAISSLWHGRNAEFLPEYMRTRATPSDREQGDLATASDRGGGDPAIASDRRGQVRQQHDDNDQQYLVCGETNQEIEMTRPRYTLHLKVVDPRSLITVGKISSCQGPLLHPSNSFSSTYKDMSLAFALSRLLRCRFEDVTLQKQSIASTRKLITSKIIESQQTAVAAAGETASIAASTAVAETEMVAAAVEITEMVPEAGVAEIVSAEEETASMAASAAAAEIGLAEAAAEATEIVAVAAEAEIVSAEVETVATQETAAPTVVTEIEMATAAAKEKAVAATEAKRAFKILELELAFARDYFHTLYPLVFSTGLGSLWFSLLLSMATFGIAFWLAVDIRKVYHLVALDKEDNFMLHMHGGNVDVLITWLFMFFMMFKEVWEMVTYLLSNWTRLLLVCKYVQSQLWFRELVLKKCLIQSFYECKIGGSWHGCMDQYDFLQSCNYNPLFRKVVHAVTLGMVPEKLDGKKSGKAIKVPECVKPAVLQALRRIGLNKTQLPRDIPSLDCSVGWSERYSWACLELHTCSQVILVWHIATSLCEIKLAEECEIDLSNPGFLRSAWSSLKTSSCCTSQPYLLNKNTNLQGELETNYHIATSLSRYCAYLQVFLSALLPDSFVVPELIFTETLGDARKQLKDCNLVLCRYNKLMAIAEEAARSNVDRLTMNIVQQGATLGKALIENEDKESRWKIIAEVWADLIVHIAPSWNAGDHKNYIESGGEFITLIWVLLSHCGIEKSSLWDKDEATGMNAHVPQRNNNSANSNIHLVVGQQAANPEIQPVEDQPAEDEIEGVQEPDLQE